MRKLDLQKWVGSGLMMAAMATAAHGENVLDCATSSTVHYKIVSVRGWGFNDCHAITTVAQAAVENQRLFGMSCTASVAEGKAFEKNCSGSGMKLHILYAKK